jgi:hypothetical protein
VTRRVSARIRRRVFFFRRVLPYQRQHLPKSICALLLLGPVALTRIARWWWRRGEKIKSSDYYYPRPGTAAPSVFTNKQEELDVIMHLLLGCLFLIPPSACVNTAHRRNYDRTGPDYTIDSLMCSSFFRGCSYYIKVVDWWLWILMVVDKESQLLKIHLWLLECFFRKPNFDVHKNWSHL